MIIMLCTSSKGGMKSVVDGYESDGVFSRHSVRLIATHVDGSVSRRVVAVLTALTVFVMSLFSGRVDLVHAHVAMRGSFWRKSLFALIARLFRVPVIGHVHGSEMKAFIAGQSAFGRRVIRYQLEAFSCVVALSDSWANYFQRLAPAARVVVLPNYVRVPVFERCYSERRPLQVLFMGLIGDRKGVFDLLAAVAIVNSSSDVVRLIIGGNGELNRCQAEVVRLGLTEAVELRGWISGPSKEQLLRDSDIFVLPSYNEGLPVSVLEAMSWGLPVVSTHVGGIPDLVRDGVDGLLLQPGDVAGLAERIAALALSASRREQMGQSGRARVIQHFSDQAVLPMIDRLYRECARGSTTAG